MALGYHNEHRFLNQTLRRTHQETAHGSLSVLRLFLAEKLEESNAAPSRVRVIPVERSFRYHLIHCDGVGGDTSIASIIPVYILAGRPFGLLYLSPHQMVMRR